MLAVAMDADEIQDYKYVALTHGKEGVKGWRWQSPDHAGTRPIARAKHMVIDQGMVETLVKAASRPEGAIEGLEGMSKMTGRTITYKLPDGTFVDKDRNPVTPGEQDLIVKVNA